MAHMTCVCGHYMTNNMDIIDFKYDCLSEELYQQKIEEAKHPSQYFDFPWEDTPEIWLCPACKDIYWFEPMNNYAQIYLFNRYIPLKDYHNTYSCDCGHVFKLEELFHCYPDEQVINMMDRNDEAMENSLLPTFDESLYHVWKCPECNHLYFIELKSNLVSCYIRQPEPTRQFHFSSLISWIPRCISSCRKAYHNRLQKLSQWIKKWRSKPDLAITHEELEDAIRQFNEKHPPVTNPKKVLVASLQDGKIIIKDGDKIIATIEKLHK